MVVIKGLVLLSSSGRYSGQWTGFKIFRKVKVYPEVPVFFVRWSSARALNQNAGRKAAHRAPLANLIPSGVHQSPRRPPVASTIKGAAATKISEGLDSSQQMSRRGHTGYDRVLRKKLA